MLGAGSPDSVDFDPISLRDDRLAGKQAARERAPKWRHSERAVGLPAARYSIYKLRASPNRHLCVCTWSECPAAMTG
jgi:hypothetical protein